MRLGWYVRFMTVEKPNGKQRDAAIERGAKVTHETQSCQYFDVLATAVVHRAYQLQTISAVLPLSCG